MMIVPREVDVPMIAGRISSDLESRTTATGQRIRIDLVNPKRISANLFVPARNAHPENNRSIVLRSASSKVPD
jgi:hypothetical protein